MINLLWTFAALNVVYLIYAFMKGKGTKQEEQSSTLADEVRFLDVPDQILARPIAKQVNLRSVDENPEWWNKKIS
ncbi:MAG: hypothetical protein HQL32_15290, partial [Planctomycetes bacterium]|nr:hypothetical protein [Planctomycetota bacterium]